MNHRRLRVRFDVMGKKWRAFVLTTRDYRKKCGKDSVAITRIDKRRIYLSPEGVNKETIIHELVHAYLEELCTSSTNMDAEDLEEVFAELVAKRGRELLDLGRYLYTRLKVKK